ncbi:MAG: hypothetical protein R3F34_14610 [Planctomycetota bacterium]
MDPLLETIGFHPDGDIDGLRAALRRPGGEVFGGDRGRCAKRVALTQGVEIVSTFDGGGLWPVYRRGTRVRGRVASIEQRSFGPFPLRVDVDVRDATGPRRASALCWSARREDWRSGESLVLAPAAFALDLVHCGPLGTGSPDGVPSGPRWLEPCPDAEIPGTSFLAAPVRSVRSATNPLSQRRFELVELDLLDAGLTVFVSRFQLDEAGLGIPRPGDWVSGTFVLVAERLRTACLGA